MDLLEPLAAYLPQSAEHIGVAVVIASIVGACAVIQRIFRKELELDQYYYLQDICLVASWALCGIWMRDPTLKLVITAGVISGLIGFCQKVVKSWYIRLCYLAVGFGVAFLGPRITFIGQPAGEFLYLPNFTTVMFLSMLWFSFFPMLFQEIDEIPGLGGGFLVTSWIMMAIVSAVSSKGFSDAVMMSLCGVALIFVFWRRHVNVYRRLGTPLSAMWGALLACASMLGASKGVAIAAVVVLPLGIFAIPIVETSICVLCAAFSPKPVANMMVYRTLVSRGIDHPTAVFLVTMTSAICGTSFALLLMGQVDPWSLAAAVALFALGGYVIYAMTKDPVEIKSGRPTLWGVSVDNFSLDYALGRVSGWLSNGLGPQMIVTPDALAALRSRSDKRYARIVENAGLVLPDGTGLVWALRFLGHKIKERIPGVEFVEHLCRAAAGHGWPVYLLGGKPGVAEKAAEVLAKRYPGLKVAGARDGYFADSESDAIADEIRESGARIVFVALGVPKQEYWIDEHKSAMGPVAAIGVGGSFDVISGTLKRAPKRWRDMHLEWLYRTIQEPSRWRRTIKLPIFVILVLLKKLHLDLWKR